VTNFWSLEENPSNEVEDRKIGAGRGGIALCFHPKMQPLVLDIHGWKYSSMD
jgi:hypothetical protein